MGLNDTIQSGVATIHGVTSDLQENVKHEAWVSNRDQLGSPKYAAPVYRKALVEQFLREIRLSDGRYVSVKAKLTFLEVITPNGAKDRVEPVDIRDRITLGDGTTGPIVEVKGLRNPGTDYAYLYEVFMGTGVGVG